MAKKYAIVHGHFYQPPRENPWLDAIETQPSAAPYHDWNERVYAECYRPNAYSRLLDQNGAIIDIHNNYAMMSFNFGPTLFSWLEQQHGETVRRIIEADQESCRRLEGHGNAIAQVFNHIIMPLASRRDQKTQILWAKHFFSERFGREPEGIWLAETAINMDTVLSLIECGIKFVILSPTQAEATRQLGSTGNWTSAHHGLDTRHAYRINAMDKSGKPLDGHVDAFFFDPHLSHDASFGDLLKDAHNFGNRVNSLFAHHATADQAVILGTDGETFGHHKPFGDMCLAYFFRKIAPKLDIIPASFGYFLAHNSPRLEVQLKNAFGEGTAWSCAHGVGRWTRDCGCKTGGDHSWRQTWRSPLRHSLHKLQLKVDAQFEAEAKAAGLDPWALRNDYIKVIEDPSPHKLIGFLEGHAPGRHFSEKDALALRELLEAQKFMLYAFTSCGWFFTDISGIETIQNLAYAARALQMGIPAALRADAEKELLTELAQAQSNVGGDTGKSLFERLVAPYMKHEQIICFTAAVEKSVGLHRADHLRLFKYEVKLHRLFAAEKGVLSYNGFRADIENALTGEQSSWAVMVSHRNKAEVQGWILPAAAVPAESIVIEPETWTRNAGALSLTLADIFRTSQENLAEYTHQNIFKDTLTRFSGWMVKNEQELDFLSRLGFPLPAYCGAPLAFIYNQQWNHYVRQLERAGSEQEFLAKLSELAAQMAQYRVTLDTKESAGLLERIIIRELNVLSSAPNEAVCKRISMLLDVVDRYKIPVLKHKIEDAFAPIAAGHLKSLGREIERLSSLERLSPGEKSALESNRALLAALIAFAQRVNFNTDMLQAK